MNTHHSDRSSNRGRDLSPASIPVCPGDTDDRTVREEILRAAAARLSSVPLVEVTIDDLSEDTGRLTEEWFTDMHGIGSAILDHERDTMRIVQERVSQQTSNPLDRLVLAFQMVGENLARDIVVRAGVRIAAESREFFPERRLDPFRTWEAFVARHLALAQEQGLLRIDADLSSLTWIIVAAGMGTKDLIAFHDSWGQAPTQMESTMRSIVTLVSVPPSRQYDPVREER